MTAEVPSIHAMARRAFALSALLHHRVDRVVRSPRLAAGCRAVST